MERISYTALAFHYNDLIRRLKPFYKISVLFSEMKKGGHHERFRNTEKTERQG